MNITLCGSIYFYDKMLEAKEQLEQLKHIVKLPPHEVRNGQGNMIPVAEFYAKRKAQTDNESWIWERKEEAMRLHFDKVVWSDAILVLNMEKNNTPHYIGANTLLEMGLAFHLKKPIFLLHPIPELSYKEEILGMKPIVIHENYSSIRV